MWFRTCAVRWGVLAAAFGGGTWFFSMNAAAERTLRNAVAESARLDERLAIVLEVEESRVAAGRPRFRAASWGEADSPLAVARP
ncbi:hypothetical protein [Limnoglobus roseus]|uniref:Uncharacterized protein n=1 Tax=Limnoglobus roseus TaxID=2598579 RepID=A0A5C1AHP7_9BACT|nr:hypothetical protein [Limnoglobus roseus]QEL17697.1 hypothetical protein PX52LOC_04696 [Limnoglobus roseus]